LKVKLWREPQAAHKNEPIEVTLEGIVREYRPEPENTLSPKIVTLVGIVIDLSTVHPENAKEPIEVTLLGIVTDVSNVHPWKA